MKQIKKKTQPVDNDCCKHCEWNQGSKKWRQHLCECASPTWWQIRRDARKVAAAAAIDQRIASGKHTPEQGHMLKTVSEIYESFQDIAQANYVGSNLGERKGDNLRLEEIMLEFRTFISAPSDKGSKILSSFNRLRPAIQDLYRSTIEPLQ